MENTCENHHLIHWEETLVLDNGRGQELLVKEALHMQVAPYRRSASTRTKKWKSLAAGLQ